jgi:cystine transport system substrate-binding protein
VSGAQILVRKGDQDKYASIASLDGRVVGVGLGSNYEAWLKNNAPKVRIQTYSGINTALQDLEIGRVDAIINDRLESAYLLKHTDGRVVAAGQPFSKQYSGIAMRQGHPQLQAHIDAALQALRKDGQLAAISNKWFGMDITR